MNKERSLSFKFKYVSLFILFGFLSNSYSFSQNKKLDSLLILLRSDKEDTNKVITLNGLVIEFTNTNPDTALYFTGQARSLSKSLNYKKGIATSFYQVAVIYYYQNEYPTALKNYLESLKLFEEIKDEVGIANAYSGIGNVYFGQGNFPEAIKNYNEALKKRQEIGKKNAIANTYSNIGNVYNAQGSYPLAIKNYLSSLKIREEIGDKMGIAASCNGIGTFYLSQSNYSLALKNFETTLKIVEEFGDKRGIATSQFNIGNVHLMQKKYEKALENYSMALKIYENIEDKGGMANTYIGIGNIYYVEENHPLAFKNYLAALEIQKHIGNKEGMSTSYCSLGSIELSLKHLKNAKQYFEKSLIICNEIKNLDGKVICSEGLAQVDSAMGDYKSAFEHHKLYIAYRDSLNNEETQKKSLEASMRYEFDKKEIAAKAEQDKKDIIAKEEKQKQSLVTMLVSGVLLLVILFSIFLFNRFRVTNKQKQIIQQQKVEVDSAYELLHERNKEVMDSINYAERIQRALLASKTLLDENLNDYFILFKPKDVVSGDFYWATKLSNTNFALVTADSTGHGVPGAIMSILNIACLDKAVTENSLTPDLILNETRKLIINNLKNDGSAEGGKDGMDASLLSIDFKNKILYCAAANNPVWIIRDKTLTEIKADRMPVGKHDKDQTPFTLHTIDLQKGDTIYTLTDGFPDQFGGESGKKFKSKQLQELLVSVAHEPMPAQKEKLNATFDNWKGDLEQVDDVCLIGIRV